MQRFCYLLGVETRRNDSRDVYEVYDRIRGFGSAYGKTPIATVYDVDDAQRIVDLLNQDAALQGRQGLSPVRHPDMAST